MAGDRSRKAEIEHWRRVRRRRPPHLVTPGPGQESVWDYPRPPRVERESRPVRVEFAGAVITDSTRALRVLETASPPTFYVPCADVRLERLSPAPGLSLCEWKGVAHYWSLQVGSQRSEAAAWSYPEPLPGYEALRDHLAFFPARVQACYVGDVRVLPQPGGFYGGWITPEVVGPFKGDPGTESW